MRWYGYGYVLWSCLVLDTYHCKTVERPKDENIVKPLEMEDIKAAEPTKLISLRGGSYWLGSQFFKVGDKIAPTRAMDGAKPRRKVTVKPFELEEHAVTNLQFAKFVMDAEYVTEAEKFGWSFVLEGLASPETVAEVDGPEGYGRVKESPHWLAVKGASWGRPLGPDSSFAYFGSYPVVHISYNDAQEYCAHIGRRLPSEKEWEFAARNGFENKSYPWGTDTYIPKRMNVWQGKFPKHNTLEDGYAGLAPAKSFPANTFGFYNLLGNCWEWVSGGKPDKRILRGGSFLDSIDGAFNHIVVVSTKQVNGGDSGANNIGFRCAKSPDRHPSSTISSDTSPDNAGQLEGADRIEL